ncbi:MAG: apolipoprotein N-acyltransferase [Polyangiaceae bacterium]
MSSASRFHPRAVWTRTRAALVGSWRALSVCAAGGVIFALGSPPTDIYPFFVLGMAVLAAVAIDATTAWRAFGRGALWGTAAGLVGLRFVPEVILRFTPLGVPAACLALLLLSMAQSLVWAACAGVAHLLHRRARAPIELAFAAGVMVAVCAPTVFLWTPAGLTSRWVELVQLADLVGERGVSVIFGVMAALLARAALVVLQRVAAERQVAPAVSRREALGVALRRREVLGALGAALLLPVLLFAHGAWRVASIEGASSGLPTARIALVDQSVGPEERWVAKNHAPILRTLKDLTRRAEGEGSELTVWPEAAYPYPVDHDAGRVPGGESSPVGRGVRGPLLIGLITRDPPVTVEPGIVERNKYNSATVVARDGSIQSPADKLQLLWFGEMVPGGQYFPWLRRLFVKSGSLLPGTEPRALELTRPGAPTVRMAVLNCYEDTLPDVGRLVTRTLSPNLLVNITNDAWFHGTAESELHARLASMRAIEMRRDLVRAVNMGVTTWVDASGRVRSRRESQGPDVLVVEPRLREGGLTVYARAGDRRCGAFVGAAAAGAGRARRRLIAAAPARGEIAD